MFLLIFDFCHITSNATYDNNYNEDRKKNAELFEDAFYKKNNLEPNMVSEEVDMELLMKALANPEMRALLNSLAKTMK